MNLWIFVASIVRCVVEDGVAVVGIGDDAATPENFLILTRLLEGGPGDDEVGLQTSRSAREFTDAVGGIRLASRSLSLAIRPALAAKLGGSAIEVDLAGAVCDPAELTRFLQRLFDDGEVGLELAD